MTEQTVTEHTSEHIADPAERALANGYKEPDALSREQRAKFVLDSIDHAMKHNAPISLHVAAEIKALLGAE